MDFGISSLFGGTSGVSAPMGTGSGVRPEYYFGDKPVYGTTAVESPANRALGVAGGAPNAQTAMPAGASMAPPKQNSMSGGSGVGSQLADSLKAIGDMIANYQMAGAYGEQTVAAATPNTTVQPALAQFSLPTVARRV